MLSVLVASVYLYTTQANVYVGLDKQRNWQSARDICSTSVTGQLATFGNAEEFSKIVELYQVLGDHTWIGLSDIGNE